MKVVTAVLFNDQERREVAKALRWIGLHPEAERVPSLKRATTVRQEISGTLHSISDGTEPVFGERLDRARAYIEAMATQALKESQPEYWASCLPPISGTQTEVLVASRREAVADLGDALGVLLAAVGDAQHIRPLVDEERFAGI